MKSVYSFDVFDTCLIRRLAAPSDIFYEVAQKISVKLGLFLIHPQIEDFVAARINAERFARQKSIHEDTSLEEIWQNLSSSMGWRYDESLKLCELETEDEWLAPVSSIREQAQAARKQGHRIVFVSDMYLPKDFIEQQLIKYGIARAGDGLYVSSDVGKTKVSGNLFKYMLEKEGVHPTMVWHTGDNQYSDYAVPRKLGMHANLFSATQLTKSEISIMQSSHDLRATTRIAGAMRAFRLCCEPKDKKNINELTSQFVAPFVMGFATWVLKQAREDGIKRLYFLSRDCQLICKVARELSPQFGGIDCRYLYVSRQALFLPSAGAISPEEMPWMERSFEKPTLDRLLAKLELEYQNVEKSFDVLTGGKRGKYQLKSSLDWKFFWNALNEEPTKTRVIDVITMRREAARCYFKSMGMFDEVPWAVVDLGWHLVCQQSLWKLLRQADWEGQIFGYYMELNQRRLTCNEAGNAKALFYQNAPDHPCVPTTPISNPTLLEHVVGCSDHPTVHHYEKVEGRPQSCFAKRVDQISLEFCEGIHGEALKFVSQNKNLADRLSDTAICRKAMESLVTSFIRFPTKEIVSSLRELSAASDQNNLDTVPIIRPLNTGDALLPLLPRREPFTGLRKNREPIWLEGAMAATPFSIKHLLKITQCIANLRVKVGQVLLNRY